MAAIVVFMMVLVVVDLASSGGVFFESIVWIECWDVWAGLRTALLTLLSAVLVEAATGSGVVAAAVLDASSVSGSGDEEESASLLTSDWGF